LKKVRTGAHAWALLIVVFLAVGVGSAGSASSPTPTHYQFKQVCGSSLARWSNCGAIVVASSTGTPLASTTPPAGALGPTDFHTAYDLPTDTPGQSTIAIVDAYDDPSIETDLAAYDDYYGLPDCTTANGCFRKVNQTGGTSYPTTDSGWSLEISLDVETAHEICQNCNILLVEATNSSLANLGIAENEAATLGANVISNSWLSKEYSAEISDEAAFFHHPGIAITAATGDNGYGTAFPAASRYVTAVGGTTLHVGPDGTYLSETAWSGSGSGCSRYIAKPAWQYDGGCTRRTQADVSADADPNTGAAVFDSVPYSGQTGWFQVGGTSLATPLIAGAYALAGQTSSVNDASGIYAHRSSLHDITSGSNGYCGSYLCTAGVGYDGPTGLGTPYGLGAFGGSSSPPPPPTPDFSLSASPASGTVTAGSATTYKVSLTSTGGFSGSVALSASGLPSGAQASFSPASVSSSSTTSTLTVSTLPTTPTGSSTVTITGTSGTLSHTTSVSLVVGSAVANDFSLGVTPSARSIVAGSSTGYSVTVARTGTFTGAVTLTASGLPAGANASFSPSLVSGSSSTLTVSTSATVTPGTYPFTIMGTSGTLAHSIGATLTVQSSSQGGGDFSISVSPSSATVPGTGTTTFTVTVTPTGGFTGSVTFSTGSLPHGVSAAVFSPNPTTSTSTLTLTTAGMHASLQPFVITIVGSSGAKSHSTTLSIKV
jgi:subtilase family serine protease